MPFSTLASQPARALFPGVVAHYAHTERFTLGEVELEPGAIVPRHQHPHEQLSYIIAGDVEFTVGDETRIIGPGMCALIPGHVPHSVRALTFARVIDTFTPPRDDYR